jgi:hypothetical protein
VPTVSLLIWKAQLQGVDTICSTDFAFAAKLTDGRVVTLGDAGAGGDRSL